ncbi:MAG: T9SS type A sorting domain-containing protein [Flavobacteriales bacterium]
MRIVIFICINCAWAMAHAQPYTYFDSTYNVTPNAAGLCINLLKETNEGYLIGCNTYNGSNFNPHIYTINPDGIPQEFYFPNAPAMTTSLWYGKQFILTTDDGYLYSGIGNYPDNTDRGVLIKYNYSFDTTWTYIQYDPDSNIWFYHPIEIADGYIVCGVQNHIDDMPLDDFPTEMIISKISLSGELVWKKRHTIYDPEIDGDELLFLRYSGINVLDNGDIITSGTRYSLGNSQPFIAKLDSNGDNLQVYQFGHPTFPDWMPWLVPMDNHQFMVGYAYCFELGFDNFDYPMRYPHLMLFDADGMQALWDMEVNTTWYHRDYPMGMVRTPDGNFAKAGHYENLNVATAYIELWTPNGEMLWRKHYIHETPNPGQFDRTECYEINVTQDGGFLLCGSFQGGGNPQRGWVLKLDACGDVEDLGCPVGIEERHPELVSGSLQIAPNPANDVAQITSNEAFESITIRDITGKVVYSYKMNNHVLQMEVDVSGLAKGLYLIEADFGGGCISAQRLVVE